MVNISKEIFNKMRVAEAYGEIPEGTAAAATFATLAETGLNAAYEGYFGKGWMKDAYDAAKTEQQALDISDSIIADIRPLYRQMEATHTTSDFPLALANLRARAVREAYKGEDSQWRDFASVTTTPDFKTIRTLRFDAVPGLLLRPEGTDVKYLTLGENEDGYRVANWERALKYTWEMWVNDEVGKFATALRLFGEGARRTEVIVVLTAIRDGLPRTPLAAGAGVPNIERLREMREKLSQRSFRDTDGIAIPHPYFMSDVIHGNLEAEYIDAVLKQQYLEFYGGPVNPMSNAFTPHREPLWGSVLGRDIVGYDKNVEWLEVAFLNGFQAGPKTYVKLPTSQDYPEEGSFEDHTIHVKMGHTLGAKVVEPGSAIRAEGGVA